ncbi:MAG: PaaI family thioesterase [Dehalococcoidales bacterium]|nr:PaaI family thioesterase [Dehalococcoidales bacterium]
MDDTSGTKKKADNYVAELKAKEAVEPIAGFLKMRLLELSPGYAKVAMKLVPDYQNFNGFTFGGIIMAIADQAFAYASNSLAHPSLASQFNIHFVNGAGVDDELTAECRVVRSGRRVGISEMTVTNQDGKLIARATGTTIPVS